MILPLVPAGCLDFVGKVSGSNAVEAGGRVFSRLMCLQKSEAPIFGGIFKPI